MFSIFLVCLISVLGGSILLVHVKQSLPKTIEGHYWYSAPNGWFEVETDQVRSSPLEKGFPYKDSWQGYGIISFPLCETAPTQLHGEFRYTLNITFQEVKTYLVNLQNDIIINAIVSVTLT